MSIRQKLASDVNADVRVKTARTMGLLDWDPAPRPMPVGLNDAQGYVDAAGEGLITRDGNSMNMDMDVLGNMLAAEGRQLKQERLRGTAEDHRDLGQRVGDEARSSLAYDIDPTMAGAGVAAAGGLGAIGLMKLLARLRGR